MKYSDYPEAETIHEMDDGEAGSVIGVHLDGHLSLDEVELYIAGDPDEYLYEMGDLDVTHTHVRAVPYVDDDGEKWDDSWTFQYSIEPKEGYRPVTKIEPGDSALHFCAFHPEERADRSYSSNQFASPTVRFLLADERTSRFSHVGEAYVWLCPLCVGGFERRRQDAYAQARIEYDFNHKVA